ncbi:MAG: formate dehydrogenase subunit delta [Pseudomonadota bacterium]
MDVERLVYMANQIAANLGSGGGADAARATADHIRAYWDPRMRKALVSAGPAGLGDIACRAVMLLRRDEAQAGAVPPPPSGLRPGS